MDNAGHKSADRGRPLVIGDAKAVNVTIRMPPELTARVDAYARTWGISRSDAARRLIQDGLER